MHAAQAVTEAVSYLPQEKQEAGEMGHRRQVFGSSRPSAAISGAHEAYVGAPLSSERHACGQQADLNYCRFHQMNTVEIH